jgi:hypothetical protein
MSRILLTMHHIALCILYIALYVSVLYLHICDRPRGAESRGADGASLSRRLH